MRHPAPVDFSNYRRDELRFQDGFEAAVLPDAEQLCEPIGR